jgi:predicted HAD superfamily Cof-like phosphohydrolase
MAVAPLGFAQMDVERFHRACGLLVSLNPTKCSIDTVSLRKSLIEEEYKEVRAALDSGVLHDIAKEIADLIYVALGTAVSYGIDMDPVWMEVQRSNMQKIGPDGVVARRPDGKILKPEGWRAPDIDLVLSLQKPRV